MKVAILCLFALVAVSQAAFTVNLVQQAQPILAKTFAQARFQLRTRSDSELQTTLFQSLMETVNGVIADIQNGVEMTLSNIYYYYNILTDVLSQVQNVGTEAANVIVDIVQNAIASLFGSKQRLDLSFSNLASLVGSLIAQFDVPAILENALNAILSNDVVQQVLALVFGKGKRSLFDNILGSLGGVISGAASSLANQVAAIVEQLQGSLASGLTQVIELVTNTIAEAQATAQQLTTDVAAQLTEALAPFANILGSAYQQFISAIQSLVASKY